MNIDDKERFFCSIKAFVITEALIVLFILGVSNSWGACYDRNTNCYYANYSGKGKGCWLGTSYPGESVCQSGVSFGNSCDAAYNYPVKSLNNGSKVCTSVVSTSNWTSSACYVTIITCDTQAEADSVYCVNNPTDPSCVQDTTYRRSQE